MDQQRPRHTAFRKGGEGDEGGEKQGGPPPLPERLARAGLRLKPSEYIMAQLGCGVVLLVLSYIRFGVSVVVPIVGLVGLLVPGFYLRIRTGRRLKQMNDQHVGLLSMMGNSLDDGH